MPSNLAPSIDEEDVNKKILRKQRLCQGVFLETGEDFTYITYRGFRYFFPIDLDKHANVFIKGIGPHTTEMQIADGLIDTFGAIDAVLIPRNTVTGEAHGVAIIAFRRLDDAVNAVSSLSVIGLHIRMVDSPELDDRSVYLGRLPPSLDHEGLLELVTPYGLVLGTKILVDTFGKSKCTAFVKVARDIDALNIILAMNGLCVDKGRVESPIVAKLAFVHDFHQHRRYRMNPRIAPDNRGKCPRTVRSSFWRSRRRSGSGPSRRFRGCPPPSASTSSASPLLPLKKNHPAEQERGALYCSCATRSARPHSLQHIPDLPPPGIKSRDSKQVMPGPEPLDFMPLSWSTPNLMHAGAECRGVELGLSNSPYACVACCSASSDQAPPTSLVPPSQLFGLPSCGYEETWLPVGDGHFGLDLRSVSLVPRMTSPCAIVESHVVPAQPSRGGGDAPSLLPPIDRVR